MSLGHFPPIKNQHTFVYEMCVNVVERNVCECILQVVLEYSGKPATFYRALTFYFFRSRTKFWSQGEATTEKRSRDLGRGDWFGHVSPIEMC